MEREHLGGIGKRFAFCAHAVERSVPLTCEYAEYKNRICDFTVRLRPLFSWSQQSNGATIVAVAGDSAMTDDSSRPATSAFSEQRKPLSPAATRALAEAEARRQAAAANARPAAKESGGPKGPEPTRYGDWENRGIASDF